MEREIGYKQPLMEKTERERNQGRNIIIHALFINKTFLVLQIIFYWNLFFAILKLSQTNDLIKINHP